MLVESCRSNHWQMSEWNQTTCNTQLDSFPTAVNYHQFRSIIREVLVFSSFCRGNKSRFNVEIPLLLLAVNADLTTAVVIFNSLPSWGSKMYVNRSLHWPSNIKAHFLRICGYAQILSYLNMVSLSSTHYDALLVSRQDFILRDVKPDVINRNNSAGEMRSRTRF